MKTNRVKERKNDDTTIMVHFYELENEEDALENHPPTGSALSFSLKYPIWDGWLWMQIPPNAGGTFGK